MHSTIYTLNSVVNATKEMNMAHTLGAIMGRDDSSERPMLLRYCDSRRDSCAKGQSLVRI